MRPGQEINVQVAREIFGHEVFVKDEVLHEKTRVGDRPLHEYSKEIKWAWEVAQAARVTLIPIVGGQWFAFAAGNEGWESPQELTQILEAGDFANCGASVSENAPEAICQAALVATQKKKLQESASNTDVPTMLM